MRRKRQNLTVVYRGELPFIPASFGITSMSFRRDIPVENVSHEMVEKLFSAYPGEFEIVDVDNPDSEIVTVTENFTFDDPVVDTVERVIRRRSRRKTA